MTLSEDVLYFAARRLYKTEVAHSTEMKQSLASADAYSNFRAKEIARVASQVKAQGIDVRGKTVLDVGCNDGALSQGYLEMGAAKVLGIDIDESAIRRARERYPDPRIDYTLSTPSEIPLPDECADVAMSYDVFEHVAEPAVMTRELFRILRPGGQALIGTQSWRHPFAPHLWSTMPVPWAHVLFNEATLLSVCQRVYKSTWYRPVMHDFDAMGRRLDKYKHRSIPREYLNRYLIRDFERTFRACGFLVDTRPVPFGSRYARWTQVFLGTPLREFLSGYVWFVLTRPKTKTLAKNCPG
jgi:2-polyprenyl-3-methyl-5-hydroxy-6-metoxy-1,4-benzoquinol methylase